MSNGVWKCYSTNGLRKQASSSTEYIARSDGGICDYKTAQSSSGESQWKDHLRVHHASPMLGSNQKKIHGFFGSTGTNMKQVSANDVPDHDSAETSEYLQTTHGDGNRHALAILAVDDEETMPNNLMDTLSECGVTHCSGRRLFEGNFCSIYPFMHHAHRDRP